MIEIFDCDQNSTEWYQARCGIPTASMFGTIMAKGRSGGESETRKKYMYRLAGEIITGRPEDTYSNSHMQRGHDMEDEARRHYEFVMDVDTRRVGFVRNGRVGCSPDSLIGERGVLEIKSCLPSIIIGEILKDEFPPRFKAQTQGILKVCERDWVDITVHWQDMPKFIKRAVRDEPYLRELEDAIVRFNDELDEIVERVRGYDFRKSLISIPNEQLPIGMMP